MVASIDRVACILRAVKPVRGVKMIRGVKLRAPNENPERELPRVNRVTFLQRSRYNGCRVPLPDYRIESPAMHIAECYKM
jgi:hypothetical protein